jgi:tetratricopeptide (TPR) repeat protein
LIDRITGLVLVCLLAALPVSAESVSEEVQRAIVMATEGEYRDALGLFREQLARKDDDPLLNYYVGLCHFYLKETDQAVVFLNRAVEKKAPFPQAFYWLTQARLAKDQDERALEVLRRGLDTFPKNLKLRKLEAELRKAQD